MRKIYVKKICVMELFIFFLMISCSSNDRMASKKIDLSDKWSGIESGWGWVTIHGNSGTYTGTYGPEPGKFIFERIGDNEYSGTWGESDKRHGTLSFTISEDGKKIIGTYIADEDCEIDPGSKGSILWIHEWNPRVYNIEYSFEMFPEPNKIDRAKDLKLWIPIPREWDSQKAVKIISVQPEPHAKYIDPEYGNPILFWDFGQRPEKSSYKVDIKYSLESYYIEVNIDPERVGSYDKTSEEYVLYTRSTKTINITPKIEQMAQDAVGNETNPYLQAKCIFDFVRKKMRYKLVRHERGSGINSILNFPVIDQETGEEYYEGQCEHYSLFFVALCRAVEIPARGVTGILGWDPGIKKEELKLRNERHTKLSPEGLAATRIYGPFSGHTWAEFYLPEYGWIPVDPTSGVFNQQNNFRVILSKGRDVKIGPYAPQETSEGYGDQWILLHNGRANIIGWGVWNIAKIRVAEAKILHTSDLLLQKHGAEEGIPLQDRFKNAKLISSGTWLEGSFQYRTDEEWFTINVEQNKSYFIYFDDEFGTGKYTADIETYLYKNIVDDLESQHCLFTDRHNVYQEPIKFTSDYNGKLYLRLISDNPPNTTFAIKYETEE